MIWIGFGDVSLITREDVVGRIGEISEGWRGGVLAHGTDKGLVQSFGGKLLLSKMLAQIGIFDPVFEFSTHGKPRIASARASLVEKPHDDLDELRGSDKRTFPRFNISHSDGLVACALANCEVGCDVERVRELKSGALRAAFLPYEQEFIGQSSERFYTLWTIKESYIKLKGESVFTLRPDKIKTKWNNPSESNPKYEIENSKAQIHHGTLRNYVYAISTNSPNHNLKITELNLQP